MTTLTKTKSLAGAGAHTEELSTSTQLDVADIDKRFEERMAQEWATHLKFVAASQCKDGYNGSVTHDIT